MARRRLLLASLLLLAAVGLLFGRTASHDFLNFDDDRYVTANPGVRSGLSALGLRWAFTNLERGNWHPLTWLSHQLDWTLFGKAPAGHHLVNVAWHGANAVLLLLLMHALTGALAPALLVAALFAVHPLHVESVAWVAERKDLLSTFLWLAATLAYLRRLRRPAGRSLLPVAVLFALALAAKPMPVTFPLTLLILDFWPLGRLAPGGAGAPPGPGLPALLAEKLALFALSAAAATVALGAQRSIGAMADFIEFPLLPRLGNALLSFLRYGAKTLLPANLAIFHPFQAPQPAAARAALRRLAAATAAAVRRRRRHPWLLAGWSWYLVTLLPVIGVIQVGDQAFAERYSYVPLVGLFLAAAWSARAVPVRSRRALAAGALAAVLALAAITWREVGYWKDSETLFSRAVAVTGGSATAHNNLGVAFLERGDVREAIPHFEAALLFRQDHANARFNLGLACDRLGRTAEAVRWFEEGLRRQPRNAEARRALAGIYRRLGRHAEAERVLAVPPAGR